jgi:hypothetical protein
VKVAVLREVVQIQRLFSQEKADKRWREGRTEKKGEQGRGGGGVEGEKTTEQKPNPNRYSDQSRCSVQRDTRHDTTRQRQEAKIAKREVDDGHPTRWHLQDMKSRPKSPLDSSPLKRGARRGVDCLEGSASKPELFLLREQTRRRDKKKRADKKKFGRDHVRHFKGRGGSPLLPCLDIAL